MKVVAATSGYKKDEPVFKLAFLRIVKTRSEVFFYYKVECDDKAALEILNQLINKMGNGKFGLVFGDEEVKFYIRADITHEEIKQVKEILQEAEKKYKDWKSKIEFKRLDIESQLSDYILS